MPLGTVKPLCATEEEAEAAAAAAARAAAEGASAAEVERDPETYDDGEFYQTLLKARESGVGRLLCAAPKGSSLCPRRCRARVCRNPIITEPTLQEFIESGVAGSMGGQAALRSQKKRKVVDRRASKGRKLRYHVQEKLVNFMTPVVLEHTAVAAQVFSNLFGSRAGNANAEAETEV